MTKGEQTRQVIVARARQMAHRVGLEQVTVGQLAAELGLSKSGLFAHFKSKQALQLEVVADAVAQFTRQVVVPALGVRRGLPRVEALFEHYRAWIRGQPRQQSGCILLAFSYEYDDRPGPVRDALAASQRDWHDAVARIARTAAEEGHFAADLDVRQFAFEFEGLGMAFQQSFKFAGNTRAEAMFANGFAALLARSRPH